MAKRAATSAHALSADDRIVALIGADAYMREGYTNRLRDMLVKARGEVDVVRFDGEATSAADILDECRSFGLMASHKLVVVDNADQFVKEGNRPLVERYAAAPSDGATLVLRSTKWNKGNLDKAIEAVGGFVSCDPLGPDKLPAWCVKVARDRQNATLEPEAAYLLVDRIGADMSRLASEVAKLAAAAGEGNPITPELVAQFVGLSREEKVWGIQSTIAQGTTEQALGHLRYVLDVSREPTVLVSWALVDLARKTAAASAAMAAGANPGDIGKSLKLWGDSARAITDTARRTKPRAALEVFRRAVEADVRQKTGLGDPERTLERLVVQMTMSR